MVFVVSNSAAASAEQLTEGASALLELAKKSNATSPVEAQPQQPQKTVYLVRHSVRQWGCCTRVVFRRLEDTGDLRTVCSTAAVAVLPVGCQLSMKITLSCSVHTVTKLL
jgi:hypothetical protein